MKIKKYPGERTDMRCGHTGLKYNEGKVLIIVDLVSRILDLVSRILPPVSYLAINFFMQIIPLLVKEMDVEAAITKKIFEHLPEDKWDWKPHEKSMNIRNLAGHIAELPGWITMALTVNELDFAKKPYAPPPVNNKAQLLNLLESSLSEGRATLAAAKDDILDEKWTLRNGDMVLAEFTRYEVIRHAFAQITHHRAQLGVYQRLLDIAVAGSYGPSADEK